MNQYILKNCLQSKYLEKVFKLSIIGILIVLLFTGIFHLFDHNHFTGFGEEEDEQSKFLDLIYILQ